MLSKLNELINVTHYRSCTEYLMYTAASEERMGKDRVAAQLDQHGPCLDLIAGPMPLCGSCRQVFLTLTNFVPNPR
jgi:hypothetical protein